MALMTYCATPFPWCKRSPAGLLMGMRLRGNIPAPTTQLISEWSYLSNFRQQNDQFKARQKQEYDQRHGVQDLPPIPNDTEVWIMTDNQTHSGTVVRPANTSRSYIIQTPSGDVRRNRQQLNVVLQTMDGSTSTNHKPAGPAATTRIATRSRSGTAIHPPDRLY